MSPLVMLIALGIGFLFILGAGVALLTGGNQRQVDQRLQEYVSTGVIPTDQDIVQTARPDVADRLDEVLDDRGLFSKVRTRIAKADVRLRVSEYIVLQFLIAVGTAAVIFFIFSGGLLLAIIGFIVGLYFLRIYLNTLATRRLYAFENQLSDTLNLWVNALRSGYSVLQGMEAIATELPAPVSKEFERVVQEVRLGLSLPQALGNMLRRLPSEDLDLIVTAVNIQREVGGNLTEILDSISFTIRERVRIKGQIRALTAQGRLTGYIIGFLPIILGFVMYLINPEYGGQLIIREDPMVFSIPCGWLVIAFMLLLMAAGVYAVRRIVDIEI